MLTRAEAASDRGECTAARALPVVPGRVYELRALLRHHDAAPGLSLSTLRSDFVDTSGRRVDPRLVGRDLQLPHLDPIRLETLPAAARGETAFDAGLAARFLAAPPDAAEVHVEEDTEAVMQEDLKLPKRDLNLPEFGGRIGRILHRGRWYEQEMLDFIRALDLSGTYLDVGANLGNHSVYFAVNTPAERVISFEPSTKALRALRAFLKRE